MPDISALYPGPPQAQTNALANDPLKLLGALGQINQLQLFDQTFRGRKAIGEAYQKAIKSDGSIDTPTLMREIQARPDAAFLAGEASQGALARQGQQLSNTGQAIANVTNLFQQKAAQTKSVMDGLGTLADKPDLTKEDVYNHAVSWARNSNIPSPIINGLISSLPSDPAKLRSALVTIRNGAMGSAATATPDVTGFGPGNEPVTGTRGQAGYERAGVGAGAAPIAAPGGVAPISRAPGIIAPAPGVAEAQVQQAKTGQEAATKLQNAATEIPQMRTQLDLMRNDLKQAETKFGPTAKYEKSANVIANRVLGFHPTMTKEEIAGLESFDKVGRQVAMSQAGMLHATDATLHTALGANPNTDLSAFGNEGIINMLHGNTDALAIKSKEWNKAVRSGVGPDKFYQWSDQFNQSFDPRVFQFMRMNKAQQATLLKNIDDKGNFERRLIEANDNGWIKLPKQEQK